MALSKILPASIAQPNPTNFIINGAMNVAQRGVSSTGIGGSSGFFTCDRWNIDVANTTGRLTMTQDSSAPEGFANSIKLACTTADTSIASDEQLKLQQKIEGQNLQAFAKGTSSAKPFAVSFYVKGNASATYVCELFDEDNTRQCSKTFNVTTDWTRVELTFPADTTGALDDDNASSLTFRIYLHAGSNFTSGTLNSSGFASNTNANRAVGISSIFDSTDRTFFITGVSLEVGSQASDFQHEDIGTTLAKCQRYYFEPQFQTSNRYGIWQGQNSNGSNFNHTFFLPVSMRAIPTTLTVADAPNDSNFAASSGVIATMSEQSGRVEFTSNGTSATSYYFYSITADAEL